jgi:hypothetical protein
MKKSKDFLSLIKFAKLARKGAENLSLIEKGPSSLEGYCGIATAYLFSVLKSNSIDAIFVVGSFRQYNKSIDDYNIVSGHCWLEYKTKIIDITATQFAHTKSDVNRTFSKKVYISSINNPHYLKYAEGNDAINIVDRWYARPLNQECEKIASLA